MKGESPMLRGFRPDDFPSPSTLEGASHSNRTTHGGHKPRSRKRTRDQAQLEELYPETIPGHGTAFAAHRGIPEIGETIENLEMEGAAQKRRYHELRKRPSAQKFTRLSQLTVEDETMGYNPITGIRRVHASTPSQTTGPVSQEHVLVLGYMNSENTAFDASEWMYSDLVARMAHKLRLDNNGRLCRDLPHALVDKQANPLHGLRDQWEDVRVAVNTHPATRTVEQRDLHLAYCSARDTQGGVKIPCNMPPDLFDVFTGWENNRALVPATIREDKERTLIGEDIWTYWMVRKLCCGEKRGSKGKRLRHHMLALFRDGSYLWLHIPANGIRTTPHSEQRGMSLHERVWLAAPYIGSYRGEEHILAFARHIKNEARLEISEVSRFSQWAARVMSGKAFNAAARWRGPHELAAPKVAQLEYVDRQIKVKLTAGTRTRHDDDSSEVNLTPNVKRMKTQYLEKSKPQGDAEVDAEVSADEGELKQIKPTIVRKDAELYFYVIA